MSAPSDEEFGFAPDYDAPVPYMHRIRTYYLALGYATPYRWAHYLDVPFTPMAKPLSEASIAFVTTAALYRPEAGDQGPGAPYNSAAKFYTVYSRDTATDHDVRISHVGIDRKHTTAEDAGTWYAVPELRAAAARGLIGKVGPRFHGLPTNRSHATTLDVDCPELVTRVREDGADAVVLAANCPVCHQSISLAARALEAAGIPTVVMACARDIVEHVGVPRLLFSDFPLGNACGRPGDKASQKATLELALKLLPAAVGPRTTVQNPIRWNADGKWKLDYSNVEQLSAEELARRRAEFDRGKEIAKQRLAEDKKQQAAE